MCFNLIGHILANIHKYYEIFKVKSLNKFNAKNHLPSDGFLPHQCIRHEDNLNKHGIYVTSYDIPTHLNGGYNI